MGCDQDRVPSPEDSGPLSQETRFAMAGRGQESYLGAVNPPVYRTSTLVYPDFRALKEGLTMLGHWTDYTRNGSPSAFVLQNILCEVQPGACAALPTPSGLSAISTVLLALLNPGDHLLMTDSVYGPVRSMCAAVLRRKGIEVTYYDPLIGTDIRSLIKDRTRVVYMEQPGSLTFEVQDVPAITRAVRAFREDIVTVVDSTWASPFFFDPIRHGADIAVQSLSKYVAGHADVMMGSIVFSRKDLREKVEPVYRSLGVCVSPDDAYMVIRGLRTMAVRMAHQMGAGLNFARWLRTLPCVDSVLFPALEEDPGFRLWKRDFTGAPSLFSVRLRPCSEEALAKAMNRLRVFAMGQSWGGFESLVYPVLGGVEREVRPYCAAGYLLRIHIGLESVDDLKGDFARALKVLETEKSEVGHHAAV